MAKRKANKGAADDFFDEIEGWLGGFSFDELLGAAPVTEPDGPGVVARMVGAPFLLIKAVVLLPVRVGVSLIKLPFRVLRLILPPWGRRSSTSR